MSAISIPFLSALAALAVVLALIWLGARTARLTGLAPRAGASRRLSMIETLALDPQRRLYLVRCDERELLLLAGNGRDVSIGWLASPTHQFEVQT